MNKILVSKSTPRGKKFTLRNATRVITRLIISRRKPKGKEPNAPGPTVLSKKGFLARLSRPSIAPANRAIRTDRSAIHVEGRGSGMAAQCSSIIYADDVETIRSVYAYTGWFENSCARGDEFTRGNKREKKTFKCSVKRACSTIFHQIGCTILDLEDFSK